MVQRKKSSVTFIAFLALFLASPRSAAAVNYYPDYRLESTATANNFDIAFFLIAAGLVILAIDSILFIGHYLWNKRPAKRPRVVSQEQL